MSRSAPSNLKEYNFSFLGSVTLVGVFAEGFGAGMLGVCAEAVKRITLAKAKMIRGHFVCLYLIENKPIVFSLRQSNYLLEESKEGRDKKEDDFPLFRYPFA